MTVADGFIDRNLLDGEHIICVAKVHPLALWPLGIAATFFAISAATGTLESRVFFLLFAVVGIRPLVAFLTTECALTDRRVVGKTGFVQRKSLEMRLDKIESVQVEQGIIERIIGSGTVTITGTGGAAAAFPGIEKPFEFRQRIQEQLA